MTAFVVALFTAAILLAGVYFLFLTPGEPESGSTPDSVQQAD